MNNNKIFFTADFETLPLSFTKTKIFEKRKDLVYSWGLMSSKGKYWYGINTLSFLKTCFKLHILKRSESSEILMHNFSGFDSVFVLNGLHLLGFTQRKFIHKKNQKFFYEESNYKLNNLIKKRKKISPGEYELFADDNGSIYQLQVCYKGKNDKPYMLFFKCSYLIFMVSLTKLGESLNKTLNVNNFKKLDTKFRDKPYSKIEEFEDDKKTFEYQKRDCLIIKEFICYTKAKIGWYGLKLTAGQTGFMQWLITSLDDFKKITKQKFIQVKMGKMTKYLLNGKHYLSTTFAKKLIAEILPVEGWKNEENEEHMRLWYRGGLTHVNPLFQGKIIKNVSYYDLNSSYPFQMIDKYLPIGVPFKGDGGTDYPFKFYVVCAETELINKNGLPFIGIKNKLGVTFYEKKIPKGHIFYLTTPEFEDFKQHYTGVYTSKVIFSFKVVHGSKLFGSFVKKWLKIKNDAVLKNDECVKIFAKICLNSVYGKFATKSLKDWKIFNPELLDVNWSVLEKIDQTYWENEECWVNNPYYLPLGIAIVAYGRSEIIRTIGHHGDLLIYCDTDSIHLKHDFMPANKIDRTAIGKWKIECSNLNYAVYVGKKRYCIETIKGDISPTDQDWEATKTGLASYRLQKGQDTIINFIFGIKKIPCKNAKVVKRGKVIVDVNKELKPVWSSDYEKSCNVWFKNKYEYLKYFNQEITKLPDKYQFLAALNNG